jgi:hypothetical protein
MDATTNAHLKQPILELPITARKVTDANERLQCLPEIAGLDYVVLEQTVYGLLRTLNADYDGGFWEFYRLSNGGSYMAPNTSKSFHMFCAGNGFEGDVCANTAGIITTAMAYSCLSFRPNADHFARAYELLSEFIFQQTDAGIIRAALD